MSNNVIFQNKWIEKAVRQCLSKAEGDIYPEDMAQIRYLRIGESFDADFIAEMSTSSPPDPFVDTDGGDEWFACCLREEQIARFIREKGLRHTKLYAFGFEHEKWAYARERKARENWERFKDTIKKSVYPEQTEYPNDEAWYENTASSFWQDIPLFSGLEVLRVMGGSFPDFKPLDTLKNLKAAEFVSTSFAADDAIEGLSRLKQLCCWMD